MIIKYLNKYITTKYNTRADQSGDEKVVLQKKLQYKSEVFAMEEHKECKM
jgi:hypothetical protein